MKHYISPKGELFAFELDGSQDHLIPDAFVLATDEQVQEIQNPPEPTATPAILLQKLDAENALSQRNLRESIMLMVQAIHTINPEVDLTQIPGVSKVFEVEAQASELRALIDK